MFSRPLIETNTWNKLRKYKGNSAMGPNISMA